MSWPIGMAETLCFVEIKARATDQYTGKRSWAVTQRKQRVRSLRAAMLYLADPSHIDGPCRFDVTGDGWHRRRAVGGTLIRRDARFRARMSLTGLMRGQYPLMPRAGIAQW